MNNWLLAGVVVVMVACMFVGAFIAHLFIYGGLN